MTAAIEAIGARQALRPALGADRLHAVDPGRTVVGLVGPNGAGKTTLLHLAVGLLARARARSSARGPPGRRAGAAGRVGFLAQDSPAYARLTIGQHLQMGAWLNPAWDGDFADRRVASSGSTSAQRAGTLSGGQRAQLALTLAVAKRPELLLLDEPVASLDPLARREFLQTLMEVVARTGDASCCRRISSPTWNGSATTWSCSWRTGRGRRRGRRPARSRTTGSPAPRRDPARCRRGRRSIEASHVDKQSTMLVRTDGPILDPGWAVTPVTLDDVVLAYMRQARDGGVAAAPTLGGGAMTRFAWLQSRTQTLVVAGVLAGLAVAAAITGVQLSHLYSSLVAHCTTGCDFADQ